MRGIYQGTLRYHDDTGSYLVDCNGNKCRVDPERIDELSVYNWRQHYKGYFQKCVRDETKKSKYKTIFIHHYIIGSPPDGKVCDHINNDPTDNRLCNLQFISQRENCTKDKKSKGVIYIEEKKSWYTYICLPKTRKNINLGLFDSKEEARAQHNRALAIIETCTKEDLIALRKQYGRNAR
jgi:hypothetical protein